MPISVGSRGPKNIYVGDKPVLNVYKGSERIWPKVRLVFQAPFLVDTVDRTVYTFADVPIGGPGLIIAAFHREGGTAADLVSGTIGGAAAALAVEARQNTIHAGLLYRRISAGITTEITFTLPTSNASRGGLAVYRLIGNRSDTPFHFHSAAGSSATSRTINLNMPVWGAAVCAHTFNPASGVDWSGAGEEYDEGVESNSAFSGATHLSTVAETGRAIAVTHASDQGALCGASWA